MSKGREVRNYILHPEYEYALNTMALIQLVEGVNRKRAYQQPATKRSSQVLIKTVQKKYVKNVFASSYKASLDRVLFIFKSTMFFLLKLFVVVRKISCKKYG